VQIKEVWLTTNSIGGVLEYLWNLNVKLEDVKLLLFLYHFYFAESSEAKCKTQITKN
jgi:hypothetical protein